MEYVSVVIAILALIVSAYSVYENRKNNRIGHAPALVGQENESPTEYSYYIQNKGNGPAFFEKVEYFINLQPLEDKPLREAVREVLISKGIRFQSTITHLAQEGIMAAGEELCLGRIVFTTQDADKFHGIDDAEFAVRITYKSSHGERMVWASDDRLLSI